MTTIALSEIGESPANPRRAYDEQALSDLADSVREQGILEPLLVRPISRAPGKVFTYEIVAGHRRARAAFRAGLAEVPCVVREMDDAQALEAALVENGQREDVTPMEEAQAFGALVRLGRSAEDIASRIGRSAGYVRSRLRLLDLTDEVRALLEEGRIHVGSALLLAQVHEVQQREVAERIRKGVYRPRRDASDPYTSADVASLLAERSRRTHLALWPLEDADLVPSAGACSTCPRRTGSQRALLVEMEGDDQCLDAECWGAKTAASVERARAAGELVLEGVALHRAEHTGSHLSLDWDCDEEDFPEAYEGSDGPRCLTWDDALASIGATVTRWTLAVLADGRVERWVSAAHLADLVEPHWPDAARLLRSRTVEEERHEDGAESAQRYPGDEDEGDEQSVEDQRAKERAAYEARAAAQRAADAEKKAIEDRARVTLATAIVQHAERMTRQAEPLSWLAPVCRVALACADIDAVRAIAARRGIEAAPGEGPAIEGVRRGVEAWLVTQDEPAPVAGLLAELVSAMALRSHWLFVEDSVHGEHGPFRIMPLLDAAGVEPGTALRGAKRARAKEEAERERAEKKAAKKSATRATRKARAEREVRDGA